MRIRRSLIGCTLAAVVAVGATGCAQPQSNPDVRFTGDPAEAIPTTEPVETTTTVAPTTTLFFGPAAEAPVDEGETASADEGGSAEDDQAADEG